jgi:hypothetical protein
MASATARCRENNITSSNNLLTAFSLVFCYPDRAELKRLQYEAHRPGGVETHVPYNNKIWRTDRQTRGYGQGSEYTYTTSALTCTSAAQANNHLTSSSTLYY